MKVDILDNTLISEDEDIFLLYNTFEELREVPIYIESVILDYVLIELKTPYNLDLSLDKKLNLLPSGFIKNTIKLLNSKYNATKTIDYKDFYLPYLLYYLPCNIYKIWKPLIDLHVKNLLKPSMKVLDIGTGPGSIAVGVIEFYKEMATKYIDIEFSLSFTLIEKETEFIKIANNIINSINKHLPSNLNVEIDKIFNDTVTGSYKNDELEKYDIITLSNVLAINELDNNIKGVTIIKNLKQHLKGDGSIIIIEPGDFKNISSLKSIRNKLVNDRSYDLFSPCNRIWEERDNYNCNCISMTKTYWKVPNIYKYLSSKGLSKALRPAVPFSYVVLRIDGVKKYEISNNQKYYTKLVDLRNHCGEPVNLMAMIRTVIETKSGKIIALCDGTIAFSENYKEYCLIVNEEEMDKYFEGIPIIASERIRLKKVRVILEDNMIRLNLTEQSKVQIEY